MTAAGLIILALAATAAIALPLLRRPRGEVSRADASAAIYQAQLSDLDADEERGLVTQSEAEGARIEIQRRLLHASEDTVAPATAHTAHRTLAMAVAAVVIVAGAGLYLSLGHPDLKSRPAPDPTLADAKDADMDTLVMRLAERMEHEQDSLEGWLLLGRSAQSMGRFDLSVRAYEAAAALDPSSTEHQVALGQALVAEAAGFVTQSAREIFVLVLEREPAAPVARYYLGLADFQARAFDRAHERWASLATETTPEAPWAEKLDHDLTRVRGLLGIDAPKGPSAADIEAASAMSDAERTTMIRGMVDGLATRLQNDPNDLAGWLQLARAYAVLGETDNARAAYQSALKLEPDNAEALDGLSSLPAPVQD